MKHLILALVLLAPACRLESDSQAAVKTEPAPQAAAAPAPTAEAVPAEGAHEEEGSPCCGADVTVEVTPEPGLAPAAAH